MCIRLLPYRAIWGMFLYSEVNPSVLGSLMRMGPWLAPEPWCHLSTATISFQFSKLIDLLCYLFQIANHLFFSCTFRQRPGFHHTGKLPIQEKHPLAPKSYQEANSEISKLRYKCLEVKNVWMIPLIIRCILKKTCRIVVHHVLIHVSWELPLQSMVYISR